MKNYYLHFFKDKTTNFNYANLMDFFHDQDGFEIVYPEGRAVIQYTHPTTGYTCLYEITQKSIIGNISDLDPAYLDANFHLEIPLLTPSYIVKKYLDFVKVICNQFRLFVYSEFFQDVMDYSFDTIDHSFKIAKGTFEKKIPDMMSVYHKIMPERLNQILRYEEEAPQLLSYYAGQDIIVPKYVFLEENHKKIILAIELTDGSAIVIPPNTNYILYSSNGLKLIDAVEFIKQHPRLFAEVPGFIKGTKVSVLKHTKKLHKLLKKVKDKQSKDSFNQVELKYLMD